MNKRVSKSGYGLVEAPSVSSGEVPRRRKSIIKDLEGDTNVERDREGDSLEVTSEEEKTEGGSGAVLIVGSFLAYVSFLPSPSCLEKRPVLQLGVPFLLSLHGFDLIRSPIARCRLSK